MRPAAVIVSLTALVGEVGELLAAEPSHAHVDRDLVALAERRDDLSGGYEEFKGTGNMELHLDRRLSERRIFPAMDIQRSGTRREELLLGDETTKQVWLLRRMVSIIASDQNNFVEGTERVLDRMRKTKTNAEFLAGLNREM